MKNILFAAVLSLGIFAADSVSAQGNRHNRDWSGDYGTHRYDDDDNRRGYYRSHRNNRPTRWEMERMRRQRYRAMMARRHRQHMRWSPRPVRDCDICYSAPMRRGW